MVIDSEFIEGLEVPSLSLNRSRSSFLRRPAKGSTAPTTRMLSAAKDPAHGILCHVTRLQSALRHAVPRFRGWTLQARGRAPF